MAGNLVKYVDTRLSLAQLLLPTYMLERLTGSGKRIDDVVATLTPFQ
jgi:hypothetical protein